jgi:hypothetical protein
MNSLKPRERVLVLGMVVVIVAAVVLMLMPAGNSGGAVKLLSRDAAERQYRRDSATYIELGKQQDALEPMIAKLAYEDPATQLIPHVVRDLQVMANESGLHLRDTRPLRPHALPSGLGMRVPLEVHFKAAFQPYVIRFLYHVEDPAGRMVLDKMDVTGADARFKTVDVSAVISVFTKSLHEDSDTGQGDTTDGTQANGQG